MPTLWERVDERVLRWVAARPPTLTSSEILDFPTNPPQPFALIPELNTDEVGASLRRLHAAGFIGGKNDYESWHDLRLGPRGLVYLGEWPDLELVASALTLHRLMRAVADEAPAEEKDALTRAAGVVGRTV